MKTPRDFRLYKKNLCPAIVQLKLIGLKLVSLITWHNKLVSLISRMLNQDSLYLNTTLSVQSYVCLLRRRYHYVLWGLLTAAFWPISILNWPVGRSDIDAASVASCGPARCDREVSKQHSYLPTLWCHDPQWVYSDMMSSLASTNLSGSMWVL